MNQDDKVTPHELPFAESRFAEESTDKPYRGAAKQIGFIVGTGRCGTTILASLLNAHSKICVPPELQFLVHCYGKDFLFEKFLRGEIYHYRARDFIDMIREASPYRIEQFIDLERHFNEIDYPVTSLRDLVKGLYDDICFTNTKEVFLEQTPWYGLELHAIRKIFPELKVIHCVRDGRDVAISASRSGWWNMDQNDNLERWAREVNLIKRFGMDYPENYYELRYEDLVMHTEYEIRKLLKFFKMDYEATMMLPERMVHYFDLLKKESSTCHSNEYNEWRRNPKSTCFSGSVYAWKKSKENRFSSASPEVNKTLIDLGYEWNADGIETIEREAAHQKIRVQERKRQIETLLRPVAEGIQDVFGQPLTRHVLDPHAPWMNEPSVLNDFPGMITEEEKKYYLYIGRFYSGRGEIVELGPWLGCSTVHLLIGLNRNPNFQGRTFHVVDDFLWRSAWMDPYYAALDRPRNGESFRNLFDRFTSRFKSQMVVYEAKILPMAENAHLPQFKWQGGPIELCFVDCGRNFLVNEAWYQLLIDAFIPGRTLIVLQDWQTHKEIPERWWNQLKNFTDSKENTFEIIHEVSQGGVAAFRYLGGKRIFYDLNLGRGPVVVDPHPDTRKSINDEGLAAYEEARRLIANQQFPEALRALQTLTARKPDFALAWNDLGFLLYAAGEKAQAKAAYEKAVHLAPQDLVARKNLADFYLVEEGKPDEALSHYEKVLSAKPDDLEALTAVAHIHAAKGNTAEARALLENVLAIDPGHVAARALRERLSHGEGAQEELLCRGGAVRASILVAVGGEPDLLHQAVDTIRINTDPAQAELILVGGPALTSPDHRHAMERARASGWRVKHIDGRSGLEAAFHDAVSQARGDYLVFMEERILLSEQWLPPLLEPVEEQTDIGAVSPKVASLLGTIREAGYSILSEGRLLGAGEGDSIHDPAWNYACDTPGVSRHLTLIPRMAWEQSGGFPSRGEDFGVSLLALGAAIRNAGFRLRYQPHSVVALVERSSDSGAFRERVRSSRSGLAEMDRPLIRAPGRSGAFAVEGRRSRVLVAGAFSADRSKNSADTMHVLSESSRYEVVQRWLRIGEGPSFPLPAATDLLCEPELQPCTFTRIRQNLLPQGSLDPYDFLVIVQGEVVLPVGFLDAFLDIQARFAFDVAQPALTSRSFFSHPLLEQCPGFDAREVRIFVQHPLCSFRRTVFRSLVHSKEGAREVSAEADDWAQTIFQEGFTVGVIDAVPVDGISLLTPPRVFRPSHPPTRDEVAERDALAAVSPEAMMSRGWVLEGDVA